MMNDVEGTLIVLFDRQNLFFTTSETVNLTKMKHLYSELEIDLARQLRTSVPRRIWWNDTEYIFQFDGFHINLNCFYQAVSSPNESDDACLTNIQRLDYEFQPDNYSILVGENKSIDELFIVRTCLYFTKYIPTTESRPPQNPNYGIITRSSHKLNPLNDKWTEESGWYKQVTCHPQSTKTHEIAEAFLNTIDCGLLLEISKNYLKAFIEENLYGFLSTQLSSTDEITQIRQDYELIPVLP